MRRIRGIICFVSLVCVLFGCTKPSEPVPETHVDSREMTLSLPNGTVTGIYTGDVLDGVPEGRGTFERQDSKDDKWVYTGKWKQGVMEGTGKFEWDSGKVYEGKLKGGLMDGIGTWYQDGEVLSKGKYSKGKLISLIREKVEIAEDDLNQYVNVGEVGFKMPESWTYEVVDDNTMSIHIPDAENVQILLIYIEGMAVKDPEVRKALKNMFKESYAEEDYWLVSEDYNSSRSFEYDLHYAYNIKGVLTDIYCSTFSTSRGSHTLIISQTGGQYDYSEAGLCVLNTMKAWDSIQADRENEENERKCLELMQFLEGSVDWDALEANAPRISRQDIKDGTYKNQIVLIEGVIDNITDNSFDVWIHNNGSYEKYEKWDFNGGLNEIINGSTVEICIKTGEFGELLESKGVLAVRKLDIPVKEDMVSIFKESCENIDYKGILRNPDNYGGSIWKATGKVFQIVETDTHWQEFLMKLNDGNILYVSYSGDEGKGNILEDDNISVYGTFYMTKTYNTLFGEKTVPELVADYLDIQ